MRDGYDREGHYTGARNSTRVIQGRPQPVRDFDRVSKELADAQYQYLESMDPSVYMLPSERTELSRRINQLEDELAQLAKGVTK